ncbi:MAG: LysR family transcriptional regulator [Deltaproteobacteria bacterium]|nr:LysR family transcriptional regulator [Deltaproteobacteria bacterium]
MSTTNEMMWDDVRVFLAILRAGSLRQAATTLGLSRPTTGRRLSALEGRMGLTLFDRRSDGLHATPAAVDLVPAAEEVERAMRGLARATQAVDSELRGPVRVSLPAIVASDLLMDELVAFHHRWPGIDLHISGSYEVSSLAEREADVAVRFMPRGVSPDPGLTGRLVATAWVAAYGEGDCWIGQRGAALDAAWVAQTDFPELPVRGAILDGLIQLRACQAGMGMGYLPCFLAEPHLRRRSEPVPGLDIWVLVHPDLRRNPRLRTFRDALVEGLKRQTARLEGRSVR